MKLSPKSKSEKHKTPEEEIHDMFYRSTFDHNCSHGKHGHQQDEDDEYLTRIAQRSTRR